MKTRTKVYFGVFDFGDDPEVISTLMRMSPTESWAKGEPSDVRFPRARRTHSRWALSSGLDEEEPLEAHFGPLLTKLESRRTEIGVVAQQFPVHIGVAQYFHEVNPQFRVESDVLRRLAALGVQLAFDPYCLGNDQRDD